MSRGERSAFAGTGRYDVLERLGDGGGGVVYRAYDRQERVEVALKVLRALDAEALAHFRHSFEALREIQHPNLVRLLELTEQDGRWLLTMELVEGVSLLEHVRADGRCDELRMRGAFRQVAEALRALHRARAVHRDLKPSNVRVTAEGRAVLIDLDLARSLDLERGPDDVEPDGRPVGTAAYMAPEQAAGGPPSAASDWYSMGVMLYEALTGKLPYAGSDLEVLLAKQDVTPLPPRAHDPSVPDDLERLCLDLLRTDPAKRPTGARVLRRLGAHEEVVSGRLSLASLLSGPQPFIGRERERERLLELLSSSRERVQVARVVGAAGVGKTTLCADTLEQLGQDQRDTLTLRSVCPRYPDGPHAPIHGAVARLVEALRDDGAAATVAPLGAGALQLLERAFPRSVAGLEPKPGGRTATVSDPLEQRWRALDALRTLFVHVAERRPVLWWIDDYQWADLDTKRLVEALVCGPDAPRMLLLLSEEAESAASALVEGCGGETLTLDPFDAADASALVEALYERAAGSASDANPALARPGAPIVIHERVRHALFFGEVPDPGDSAQLLIGRRVDALPGGARRVLELICAACDPLPQDVCERASELSRAEFSRQLSALRVAALVRIASGATGDLLAPAHALVADAVDAALESDARVALHRRLAVAWVARDPARASGRLLRHQGESGQHREASQSARVAATQAHRALAFQRAAELFTVCASLDPPAQDEAGHQLLKQMAEALGHAGWAVQAATIYREAALGARAADALHMRQQAAAHLLRGAELEEGLSALRELLASVDLKLPPTARRAAWSIQWRRLTRGLRGLRFKEVDEGQVSARDLRRLDIMWASSMQLGLVDILRGAEFIQRARRLALKTGEPHRIARALCTEAWMTTGLDRAELNRTRQVLQAARELVDRLNSPYLHGHLRLAEGVVAFGQLGFERCHARCRDAERVLRDHCSDAVWEINTAQTYQLIALAHLARYDTLEHKLSVAMREAEERGDAWGYTNFLSIGAFSVQLARDAPDRARADAERALQRWAGAGDDFQLQHFFGLLAAVYHDLYRGAEDAVARLDALWPRIRKSQFLRVRFARVLLHELYGRARLLRAREKGDAALLRAVLADAAALARVREPAAGGLGHLLRANVEHARGRQDRALEELDAGITVLQARGLALWVPAARFQRGRLVRGDEGAAAQVAAVEELRTQGVRNPERFIGMMLPAFD